MSDPRLAQLRHQAEVTSQQLLTAAAEHFATPMPRVAIRFDLRGQAAGMAVFPSAAAPYIRYNLALLERNAEGFMARTLPHEVAHIVARVLYGAAIRPHGPEWRAVMQFYAAPASRCHHYDTSATKLRELRRYRYRCACGEHQLTSIRHNRVRKGMRYLCRTCGEELRPASTA